MKHWVHDAEKENATYSGKNLSQFQFVHHKSNVR